MHRAEIYCAIQMKGFTLSQIAEQEGVDRSTVSLVVDGKRTSHKVAYAIAAITGIPTERMWPGKYKTPPAYKEVRGNSSAGRLPELKEVSNG